MRRLCLGAAALSAMPLGAVANAESFGEMCLRISGEWGTQGDVSSQCDCLAEKAAADEAIGGDLRNLAEAHESDQEANDAAYDNAKAALDSCSVNS